MISWDFESHVNDPKFKVNHEVLMNILDTKGVNTLVNAQQLSDEKVCNALNEVSMEVK
ncbi:hypothetical protein KI387_023626, partial [Taxus chinensis]